VPRDDFDALLAEAAATPTAGWDFSWFDGRATEERPPWGYARLVAARMATAGAALDVQTGGGEVLSGLPVAPPLLVATEGWAPNASLAHTRIPNVVRTDRLPFRDGCFDLVVSRHPVRTDWAEVARVLAPGGRFLSQQIGAGTNRELSEAMMGPLPPPRPDQTVAGITAGAEAAGLHVDRIEAATLRVEFFDVGAVAYFLRKVIWTVPGFTVDAYRDQLRAVHDRIVTDGRFVSHSRRVLIEATR
jgi:SAM-dependent methyltransferase